MESNRKKLCYENRTIKEHLINHNQSIEILNNDCLYHVFEYLSISDRVRLERVNKRWYAVSRLSWQNFKTLSFTNDLWGYYRKKQVTRKILRKVLSRCGRFITFWDMSESKLLAEKINIKYLLTYCPNLTAVDFTSITVGVTLIKSLIENCKKLVRLVFGTTTSRVSGWIIRSTILSTYANLQALELGYTNLFGDWLEFENNNSIKELQFDYCQGLSPSNLVPALTRLNNLHTLSLRGSLVFWENPSDLNFIKLSNIKELDISNNCAYVTDDCLFEIAGVRLTSLYVGGNCFVTDVGLRAVVSSSTLEHLDIQGLDVNGSSLTDLPSLKTLWCRDCQSLEEDHFQSLLNTSDELVLIDLRNVFVAEEFIGIAADIVESRTNDIILNVVLNDIDIDIRDAPSNLKLFYPSLFDELI